MRVKALFNTHFSRRQILRDAEVLLDTISYDFAKYNISDFVSYVARYLSIEIDLIPCILQGGTGFVSYDSQDRHAEIKLDIQAPYHVQQFTIFHEIGHLIIGLLSDGDTVNFANYEEEILVETFAYSVLKRVVRHADNNLFASHSKSVLNDDLWGIIR